MTLSNEEIKALYHIQDALKKVSVESIEYQLELALDGRDGVASEVREQYEHLDEVAEDGHDLKELEGVSVAYEGSLPSEIDNREVMLTIDRVDYTDVDETVNLSILVSESDGTEYKIADLECTDATC